MIFSGNFGKNIALAGEAEMGNQSQIKRNNSSSEKTTLEMRLELSNRKKEFHLMMEKRLLSTSIQVEILNLLCSFYLMFIAFVLH